jgi:ABC-2 type transport system ATP-binding protein
MLVANKLGKRYGGFTALDDVSFTLPKGSVTALLGPNGAGKTTLLRILTAFHPPSSGDFTLGGVDAAQEPQAVKRRIGYLPEHRAAVDRSLEAVSLGARSRQLLGTLSKGFRQRAGLAMAILGEPDLLILDEPTSGLDPNQTVEVRETIRNLARQATVLFSSHLLPEVEAVCDRFLVLQNGKLLAEASRDEIRLMAKTAGQGSIRILLAEAMDPQAIEKMRQELGLEKAVIDGKTVLISDPRLPGLTGETIRILALAGADIREVHPVGGGLEAFFRKLTQ